MLKVDVDMAKLERSLKSASKKFGETNRNMVVRWGVATARELALQTQPWGNGGTRKKQVGAIETGMRAVVQPVKAASFNQSAKSGRRKILNSPEEINTWVERHRGGGKGHTRLAGSQKALCKLSDFNKAKAARNRQAGMAKGAWLGAGEEIAKRQRGASRLTLGKSFLGWTRKHDHRGKADRRGVPFRPSVILRNEARHTSSSYVVKRGHMKKAVYWGGRKTLTWYRKAAKEALDKA